MANITKETISFSYRDALDRLEELDANLIILDTPRIALPTRARSLILETEGLLTETLLSIHDLMLMDAYLSAAMEFCDSYFEPTDLENLPAIALLKPPCDSQELLKAHDTLHQQFLAVRSDLRAGLRRSH